LGQTPIHKGGVYLFHTDTHKTKRTIKIKNPKNSIEKTKRREKKNQQETTQIIRFSKIIGKNRK
jgi:hypothetical protein